MSGPTIAAVYVLSSMWPNQAPSRYAVGAPNERRAHIIRIDFEKTPSGDYYVLHHDDGPPSTRINADRVPKVEWKETTA